MCEYSVYGVYNINLWVVIILWGLAVANGPVTVALIDFISYSGTVMNRGPALMSVDIMIWGLLCRG